MTLRSRLAVHTLCIVIIAGMWWQKADAGTATWIATEDPDVLGYTLYIASGACVYPGEFAPVQTYGPVTTGTVPTPQVMGTYCYQLTAHNSAGESVPSNRSEVTYVAPSQCPSTTYCNTLKGKARRQCLACR